MACSLAIFWVPKDSTMVTMELRASGMAATARATAKRKAFITFSPRRKHTDGKEEGADDQNADGELAAELVQAHLKRGLFLLRALQQGGDPAHLCVHTGGCHQEPGPAVGDEAAGEHHVLAVSQRHVAVDVRQVLLYRQAFAGEGALRALQAGALQQPAVGADRVAGLQHHHVAHGDLPAGELDHLYRPAPPSAWGPTSASSCPGTASAFTVCTVPRIAFMVITARMTAMLLPHPQEGGDDGGLRSDMITRKVREPAPEKCRSDALLLRPPASSLGP